MFSPLQLQKLGKREAKRPWPNPASISQHRSRHRLSWIFIYLYICISVSLSTEEAGSRLNNCLNGEWFFESSCEPDGCFPPGAVQPCRRKNVFCLNVSYCYCYCYCKCVLFSSVTCSSRWKPATPAEPVKNGSLLFKDRHSIPTPPFAGFKQKKPKTNRNKEQ